MATAIKIKYSLNTAIPGSLANQEPAWTANGDVLYIGSNGTIVPIAGKRTPGTLTANQAVVVNSTSYVDMFKTAKLFLSDATANVTAINAVSNSTVLGLASNTEITTTWAIKNYVDVKVAGAAGSPGGANTQVQFNNSGTFQGAAGLTFDSTSNTLTVANTLTVGTFGGAQINTSANLSFTGANVSIPNANLAVKDLNVSGNLNVTGTLTSVDATNLQVTDSLIKLAKGNAGAEIDIGFFGTYNDGTARYTGLTWDASTSRYELFANSVTEPTTTVDTGATGYVQATLKAFLISGVLTTNSTALTATANSTYAVNITGNTLVLSTALAGSSGGTGLNTYTAEDILVANTTNGFRKLAFSAGAILQTNSTAVYWDSVIDGGSF